MRVFDRGGARPVLALHCSLAHGGQWEGLAGYLEGVSLLAPDLPGHGMSVPWDGVSDLHGESARLAIGLAEAAGQVDLIGHSFGATVALRVALERPELFRSLVLVEPVLFAAARAAGAASYKGFAAGHQAMTKAMAEARLDEAAQLFLAQWGDGTAWESLSDRRRQSVKDRLPQIAAQDAVLLEDAAGLLGWMRLEALGIPVLLLEGAHSPPIIADIHAALAERLPQVRRAVIAGAGHMSPVTHPKPVALAIQAHLDEVPASG